MKFCLVLFAFLVLSLKCAGQECSYRTDGPKEVPWGHIRATYKGFVVNTVKGDVADPIGETIPDVIVVLTKNEKNKAVHIGSTSTGKNGKFCFGVMSEGEYKIKFWREGFNSTEIEFKVRRRSSSASLHAVLEVGT